MGFVLALPGVKTDHGEPEPYLHSHMLAVREKYRNRGLGPRLKLEQRAEALARGTGSMEWTFDPLEIKNAYLNIHKLGAIACRYEWISMVYPHLDCKAGSRRIVWSPSGSSIRPGSKRFSRAVRAGTVIEERILVPASIYQWKTSEAGRERALAVQWRTVASFSRHFPRVWPYLATLGHGRKWSLRAGSPNPSEAGVKIPRNEENL